MSAQHTFGPWAVYAEGSAQVPPFVRVAKFWPQAGAYQIIADCSYAVTHGTELEANARLIAAAPDLLAALEKIMERADQGGRRLETAMNACDEILAVARAAIAKAEARS